MTGHFIHVAVTRDEPTDGPLSTALREAGLEPVACPALREEAPLDPERLRAAARRLAHYDWLVVASRRAVSALMAAGAGAALPRGLRTAAVGHATAAALIEFGAVAPLVAERAGAEALAGALLTAEVWPGKRVLLPRAEDGGHVLADALRREDAMVDEVEAYRTMALPPERVAAAWIRSAPEAAIVSSPSAARSLVQALGVAVLNRSVIIAIGPTTLAALAALGIAASTPARADFRAAADLAADRLGVRPCAAQGSRNRAEDPGDADARDASEPRATARQGGRS